jgi:hypothetical protein
MVHVNDGHLGLCLCCVSCLATIVNREVRRPLFTFGGTSRGERGCESERRERGRSLACSQCGDGEGHGMRSFGAVKLCFEVRYGRSS